MYGFTITHYSLEDRVDEAVSLIVGPPRRPVDQGEYQPDEWDRDGGPGCQEFPFSSRDAPEVDKVLENMMEKLTDQSKQPHSEEDGRRGLCKKALPRNHTKDSRKEQSPSGQGWDYDFKSQKGASLIFLSKPVDSS